MTIGDDGVASICMGIAHVGDPCERCGHSNKLSRHEIRDLESTLARTFVTMQRERVPSERQRLWTELLRLASELEKLDGETKEME